MKPALTKLTGGGFGYDRDAAAPIVLWGVPDNTVEGETASPLGEKESKAYLDAFCALQLCWVLTLPGDDPAYGHNAQAAPNTSVRRAAIVSILAMQFNYHVVHAFKLILYS
jgi:hypothetical protein